MHGKVTWGKKAGLTGPRRFKIYQETTDQTVNRAIEYIQRFGNLIYPARLLDKLLLDRGIVTEIPPET